MNIFNFCMALSAVICGNVHADAIVTVFGLPLGGKLHYQIKFCPSSSDNVNEVCWKGKPTFDENGRRGIIQMPNTDALPKWAEYAKFEMHLTKDAEIQELFVRGAASYNERTIEHSITSRFGLPTKTRTVPGNLYNYYVDWKRQDIRIQMDCGESCSVEFTSARLHAARKQIFSDIFKTDAARPVSP